MEEKNCEKCGSKCYRDSVDVGVGTIYGPWGCPECRWSESSEYDLSEGQTRIDETGWIKDQWGGLHNPEIYAQYQPEPPATQPSPTTTNDIGEPQQ